MRQVLVPMSLRPRVMGLTHDSATGGHMGARKTTNKALTNFYWPGVREDIKRYCKSCDVCQKTSPRGQT